jgi:hypothetical protein
MPPFLRSASPFLLEQRPTSRSQFLSLKKLALTMSRHSRVPEICKHEHPSPGRVHTSLSLVVLSFSHRNCLAQAPKLRLRVIRVWMSDGRLESNFIESSSDLMQSPIVIQDVVAAQSQLGSCVFIESSTSTECKRLKFSESLVRWGPRVFLRRDCLGLKSQFSAPLA